MKTKKTMLNEKTIKEQMIEYLRNHKDFKGTLFREKHCVKLYAGIRNGEIRYQEWPDSEEISYPLVDETFSLQ